MSEQYNMKDATLCYIERDGKYLMLLRNRKQNDPNEGKWIGVGGKLEPGETPEECAVREIREETGLTAASLTAWGTVYFVSDEWEDEIMRLFLVTDFEGELNECDEGELHWIDKDRIFDLNLWDGDRIFLQCMLTGRRFNTMTLQYRGDRLCGCVIDGRETELIDVYREDGQPAGYVASRDYVHWKGLWHITSHIWVTAVDREGAPVVLLQLRAAGKRLFPSRWDTSSAGHIPAGEDALTGAVRELGEELGIFPDAEELQFIGTVSAAYDDDLKEGYHDREFRRIFLLRCRDGLPEFRLQASEVERVMWIGFDELQRAIEDGAIYHCLDADELALLRRFV